ncbi:MAG: DEAD/DEAH box helicase [Firmicutes bacterium]|jgi:SNF2 family DNA or RNA helicase|nr:DEAD/DEAH box helicase [Bacillota bacterium]
MEIRITVPLLKNQLGFFPFAAEIETFSEPLAVNDCLSVQFSQSALREIITSFRRREYADWEWQELARLGEDLSSISDLANLICPVHLASHWESVGVIPYPHQLETTRKVIQDMGGRAILADEVGLGKTIEAGMILKEYTLRGLVRKVLILTPAALCWQWFEELREKFRISVALHRSQYDWARCDCIVASIDTAKREPHLSQVLAIDWDLLIVDEAHKLKNSRTQNWRFVNNIHKQYFLMLTATPVQNDLRELYNLITLLKPGQLGTYAAFKRRFVADKRTPRDTEALRSLLGQVMIRNRRGTGTIQFTERIVRSVPVELNEAEAQLYLSVNAFIRRQMRRSLAERRTILPYITLLREVCSSAWAAALTLKKLTEKASPETETELLALLEQAVHIETSAKIRQLLELLQVLEGKVIVFTEYRGTQAFIKKHLEAAGLGVVTFDGSLSANRKEFTKFLFRRYGDVLVSTESGGEGINLQYCNNVINFDLPWNPMRLEQRIGRVHRLGQTKDVYVFNFATQGTIEEHILKLLHEKINMFELVVGELDAILTHLQLDRSFESHLINIFVRSETDKDLAREFDHLGETILKARIRQREPTILDLLP